jgi:hypothetical protein
MQGVGCRVECAGCRIGDSWVLDCGSAWTCDGACTQLRICSKCRMKILRMAVMLLMFISASEVSEMPSELACWGGVLE